MPLFLGIDMGTSYFKAALFNDKGELKGLGRKAVRKSTPGINKSELSVSDFWLILQECVNEALKMAACKSDDIQAMSYSSQANSFLLVDKNNEALTPIILWTDTRVRELRSPLQQLSLRSDFMFTTGIGSLLSTQMCIAKILWVQEHQPSVWQRVQKVMTISDYLTYTLTNEAITDFSTTSLTGLLDMQKGEWWNEALEAANIPESFLSAPFRSGTLMGCITKQGAEKLGLSTGTKFCLGGLDHHIAAIGAGLCQSNNVSESTGTVLASVNYTNFFQPKEGVFTALGLDNDSFFQLTYNENGAGNLEWYQQNYAPELSIVQLIDKAATIGVGSEGLLAKPCTSCYTGLEGFFNRRPFHQHGHYIRAMLESTALSLKELIDLLIPANQYQRVVSTGGGAMSRLWIQIKADLLSKEFFIPQSNESACLGAAMLAATSIHHFSNIQQASEEWIKTKQIVEPDPVNFALYEQWLDKIKKVEKAN